MSGRVLNTSGHGQVFKVRVVVVTLGSNGMGCWIT